MAGDSRLRARAAGVVLAVLAVCAPVVSRASSPVLPALVASGLIAATLAVVPGLPHAFETPKDAVACLVVGIGLTLAAAGPAVALPAAVAAPLVAFLASGLAAGAAA